jgi:hypothetical protein
MLISDSLARAWQTLTPAEQKVLEAIECLPEGKQSGGFKRRDLKVPGVGDTRLKEILKSLAETGYLDCDGRAGPQGYTYTVARSIEEISLGIYLSARSPDSQESTENKQDISDDGLSSGSVQSSDSQNEAGSYQPPDANGRNGHRPINSLDLQQLSATGRTGGENGSGKLSKCPECGDPFTQFVSEDNRCPSCGAMEAAGI